MRDIVIRDYCGQFLKVRRGWGMYDGAHVPVLILPIIPISKIFKNISINAVTLGYEAFNLRVLQQYKQQHEQSPAQ